MAHINFRIRSLAPATRHTLISDPERAVGGAHGWGGGVVAVACRGLWLLDVMDKEDAGRAVTQTRCSPLRVGAFADFIAKYKLNRRPVVVMAFTAWKRIAW